MNPVEARKIKEEKLRTTSGTMEHYVRNDMEYLKHDQWWNKYRDILRFPGSACMRIISTNDKDIRDVTCQRKAIIELCTPGSTATLEDVLSLIPDRDVNVVFTIDPTMTCQDD